MKPYAAKTAAALVLAAGFASSALALEGVFRPAGVDEGAWTFSADGVLSGAMPDGVEITETFEIDGDTITLTASEEHPSCPGAVGVYTFVETDTDVTFTVVSDECEARAEGVTAGPWTRVAE